MKRNYIADYDSGNNFGQFEFESEHRANSAANLEDAKSQMVRRFGKHARGYKILSTHIQPVDNTSFAYVPETVDCAAIVSNLTEEEKKQIKSFGYISEITDIRVLKPIKERLEISWNDFRKVCKFVK